MTEQLKIGIEWRPEGLEHMVRHPLAEKRLKNREGCGVVIVEGAMMCVFEGNILSVVLAAQKYLRDEPKACITIQEYMCNNQSPFPPARNGSSDLEVEVPGYTKVRCLVFPSRKEGLYG